MFNLVNYLLGSHTQESGLSPEDVVGEVRLSAVDDDWVLVDKTGRNQTEDLDNSAESVSTLSVAISTIPHSLTPQCDSVDCHTITRSSSTSSLPCLTFEDSWFLTPPPCFTSEGPIYVETSPLENLLIEHPSMSVYQHSSSVMPPTQRSGSLPPSSPSSTSSGEEDPTVQVAPPVEERVVQPFPERQAVYTLQQREQQQLLQVRSTQRVQLRMQLAAKRKQIYRHNKAREINSRNQVQRRSDHMQHHSGANNNRKC